MHHKIEYDCQCESCKGSGVYVGIAERDGWAVVCHTCKGTGKRHGILEYDDFTKKHIRTDVKQVLQVNPGIVVGVGKGHEYNQASFGGIPYSDWLKGCPFDKGSEMRIFTCPAWWYQSADYAKKPDWKECRDTLGSSFSSCKHFAGKEYCWQRCDEGHAKDKNRG